LDSYDRRKKLVPLLPILRPHAIIVREDLDIAQHREDELTKTGDVCF
jgi:hypothetical protein